MSDFHTPGAEPPRSGFGTPPPKKTNGCLIAFLVVAGLFVALVVLGMIVGKNAVKTGPQGITVTSTSPSGGADNTQDAPTSSRVYSSEPDDLRKTTTSYANIRSDNTVTFDFPYGGGSTLTLTVRHDHRGDNVIFQISKGQFVCGIYNCSGDINVDGVQKRLSLNRAADGSADVLFANGEAGLIKSLKTGKKIIVELPFYQSGNQQFTFTTAVPLVWPPKDTK